MPPITTDGHTFTLDNKRIWLVSGTVHWSRMPARAWAGRLWQARCGGLNTVEVPVVWSLHEAQPGAFGFREELDIGAFVRTAGEMGLRVILRLGPNVGDGYDLGGMPAWLIPRVEGRLRTDHAEFMSRCSAWYSAVAGEVKRLQATVAGSGPRPIIGIQIEHEYFCEHRASASGYLGQLMRYAREAGFAVPVFTRTNHFLHAEGAIDTWSGFSDLHALTRQLRAVDPSTPRVVLGLDNAPARAWGEASGPPRDPRAVVRAIAETLAAGGHVNLGCYDPGLHFGFGGGRLGTSSGHFATTSPTDSAPIDSAGRTTEAYHAIRRLATFATWFERVFAHLDADHHPACIAPHALLGPELDESTGARTGRRSAGSANVAVAHAAGTQGEVVFLFADDSAVKGRRRTSMLLPNGSELPIEFGELPVSWVLVNAHLAGRSTLDFCSLNAFALIGSLFVCFGPAGAEGLISINGSAFDVVVPKGSTPLIEEHEGVTVVVLGEQQMDGVYAHTSGLFVNVGGIKADGTPTFGRGGQSLLIGPDGSVEKLDVPGASRTSPAPKLGAWHLAEPGEWVDGTSHRYALIDGPATLESLGVPSGYAWVRIRFAQPSTARTRLSLPHLADRGAVFLNGEPLGVFGVGPGAMDGSITKSLRKGEHTLVLLVDNLGRDASGSDQSSPKGVFGHVYQVASLKGSASLVEDEPLEALSHRAPIMGLHAGDLTDARRWTWELIHRRKSPLLLSVRDLAVPGLVVVNGEVRGFVDARTRRTFRLDAEHLSRGKNTIQLAFAGSAEEAGDLKACCELVEGTKVISEGAQWSFGTWEVPSDGSFAEASKGALSTVKSAIPNTPRWWRASFGARSAGASPLFFDAIGLSKGQLLLNGRNLCRYFVSTGAGEAVPPQRHYLLPGSWLHSDRENTLTVFDEHGFSPAKTRLTSSA